MDKEYLHDVATKGAILGVIMLASHLLEQTMIISGEVSRMGLLAAEMIAVFAIYVYLLYRFTKSYSQRSTAEEGFPFGKGWGYVITLAVFTSIIVGLGKYIYTHSIIGYTDYIKGVVGLYENILSTTPLSPQLVSTYEQMLERIAEQPEPSFISTISSTLWSYIFLGGLVGLIIAGIVKREPNIFSDEQN